MDTSFDDRMEKGSFVMKSFISYNGNAYVSYFSRQIDCKKAQKFESSICVSEHLELYKSKIRVVNRALEFLHPCLSVFSIDPAAASGAGRIR